MPVVVERQKSDPTIIVNWKSCVDAEVAGILRQFKDALDGEQADQVVHSVETYEEMLASVPVPQKEPVDPKYNDGLRLIDYLQDSIIDSKRQCLHCSIDPVHNHFKKAEIALAKEWLTEHGYRYRRQFAGAHLFIVEWD